MRDCEHRDRRGVQCERDAGHGGKHNFDLATGGVYEWSSGGLVPEKLLDAARAEVERLERKTKEQARQLTYLKEANHARNVEMDALHFVWCDGGCKGGVHRWTENTITIEVVEAAERNAKRLRSWFINATARAARALASAPTGETPK